MTALLLKRYVYRAHRGSPSRAVLVFHLLMVALTLAALPAEAANVAVLMSMKDPVYEQALRGFEQSSQHQIAKRYDMEGNRARGRRLMREIKTKLKPDLVLVVGLWALEVALEENIGIPVAYVMVLNPPNVVGATSRPITGASMNVPVDRTMQILKQLGDAVRRIGAIYDPRNTGYLVEEASRIAAKRGLELVAKEARTMGDAVAALKQLEVEGVDVLWILPDKTVLLPAFLKHMLRFSFRNRVPILGLSARHSAMGAVVSLYADSEDVGRQAGELVNKILGRKAVGSLRYTTAREVKLVVNLRTAKKIGMEVPESLIAAASEVIH